MGCFAAIEGRLLLSSLTGIIKLKLWFWVGPFGSIPKFGVPFASPPNKHYNIMDWHYFRRNASFCIPIEPAFLGQLHDVCANSVHEVLQGMAKG